MNKGFQINIGGLFGFHLHRDNDGFMGKIGGYFQNESSIGKVLVGVNHFSVGIRFTEWMVGNPVHKFFFEGLVILGVIWIR